MSGRRGVFVAVKARYPLGDPGRITPAAGGGSVAVLLACGHARTSAVSQLGEKCERMWCRLCTVAKSAEPKPEKKQRGVTVTPAQLKALVEKAVNRRLDELTRPALPEGAAK